MASQQWPQERTTTLCDEVERQLQALEHDLARWDELDSGQQDVVTLCLDRSIARLAFRAVPPRRVAALAAWN